MIRLITSCSAYGGRLRKKGKRSKRDRRCLSLLLVLVSSKTVSLTLKSPTTIEKGIYKEISVHWVVRSDIDAEGETYL